MIQIEDWLLAVDVASTKMGFEFNSYRCTSVVIL